MKNIKHTAAERRAIEAAFYLMLRQVGECTEAARWIEKTALPYHRKVWGTSSKVASMAGLVDFYHEGTTNGRKFSMGTYSSYDAVSIKMIALGAQWGDPNRPEMAEALDAQGAYRERVYDANSAAFDAKHGEAA